MGAAAFALREAAVEAILLQESEFGQHIMLKVYMKEAGENVGVFFNKREIGCVFFR